MSKVTFTVFQESIENLSYVELKRLNRSNRDLPI
ncbi:MAG: hypothetical protein ACI9LG_001720 [Moritella dasanensis]|jgi:hypothetical protein